MSFIPRSRGDRGPLWGGNSRLSAGLTELFFTRRYLTSPLTIWSRYERRNDHCLKYFKKFTSNSSISHSFSLLVRNIIIRAYICAKVERKPSLYKNIPIPRTDLARSNSLQDFQNLLKSVGYRETREEKGDERGGEKNRRMTTCWCAVEYSLCVLPSDYCKFFVNTRSVFRPHASTSQNREADRRGETMKFEYGDPFLSFPLSFRSCASRRIAIWFPVRSSGSEGLRRLPGGVRSSGRIVRPHP